MIYKRLVPFWEGSKRPGGLFSGAAADVSIQALRSHLRAFSVVKKNMHPIRWDLPRVS